MRFLVEHSLSELDATFAEAILRVLPAGVALDDEARGWFEEIRREREREEVIRVAESS
jgi:hypothetical protein